MKSRKQPRGQASGILPQNRPKTPEVAVAALKRGQCATCTVARPSSAHTLCYPPFCLAGHEPGHVPPPGGSSSASNFPLRSVHDLVKTKFAKKGKLCLLAAPSTQNLASANHETHRLCTSPHPHPIPLQLHIPLCGNWPIPTCRPHDPNHAMPQLTSSFASAAAGQNRDSRGSGRSDSARGAGSGEW